MRTIQLGFLTTAILMLTLAPLAEAQSDRPLIDVQSYDIEARIDPPSHSLEATAKVTFIPREETAEAVFELHNGLNVTNVTGADGISLQPLRYRQDFTLRLSFPEVLPVDQPYTATFTYNGQIAGIENSPVEGLDLANIHAEGGYLLYPGRWFPVNGYAADQFAANIHITVPDGFDVLGSGLSIFGGVDNGRRYSLEFSQQSFPGSIAIVTGEPQQVEAEGVTTTLYLKTAPEDLVREYGEATGEMMSFFSEVFGAPYSSSLTVVELGEYSPDAYASPGMVFLGPYGMGQALNRKLLGTQVAHQWWRSIVTPGNRNQLWLDHALAWYSALLEIREVDGEEAFEQGLRDARIEALTYTDIPINQASRLPDFSPELDALAGAKGVMVLNMLSWVVGQETFENLLAEFAKKFAWKSVISRDLQEMAEQASGRDLEPFFIQWVESTETPEFTQEYTIYRLGQGKGFRIIGKVRQDMDTFQMPVELQIETEGEPEYKTIQVSGTSSDYVLEAFGKPRRVVLDPNSRILRFDDSIRVQVAIRKGEQLVGLGYYTEALQEYQSALDINRFSSLAHYRIGEAFFFQNNYQSAANEFRDSLNGDNEPEWTVVWAHVNLGMIFDVTGQRDRAVNEYQLAIRTRDNTHNAQETARKYLEKAYRRPRQQERIY